LNYKLFENASQDEIERNYLNYFEKSLRRYNKLQFNSVFDDMRSENLELYSVAMGPFKQKPSSLLNFEISTFLGVGDNVTKRWSLKDLSEE
jgi:hypothetical protein